MHRVYPFDTTDINSFTASYYNSLSFASAEVCGRSHGGGVLELMPNETENIFLPYHEDNKKLLPIIDDLIRKKTHIDDILLITDKIILKDCYGLSNSEVKMAHKIWKKLSNRRLNRRR